MKVPGVRSLKAFGHITLHINLLKKHVRRCDGLLVSVHADDSGQKHLSPYWSFPIGQESKCCSVSGLAAVSVVGIKLHAICIISEAAK